MTSLLRNAAILAVLVVYPPQVRPQDPPPEQGEPAGYEFVSGTIAELPPGKIVVNRAVLGKPPEMRTFTITAETKVEGKLRTRERVTVGFRLSDEGDAVAVRIIVRPAAQRRK